MKRTVAGIYLQTVLFHILIVTVKQEMKFLSCMSQFSSIISTNGTCANHSVSHFDNNNLLNVSAKIVKSRLFPVL